MRWSGLLALSAALLLLLPAAATAAGQGDSADAGRISAAEATAAADRDAKVIEQRRGHPDLTSSANVVDGNWEVGYFADGEQVALVIVDPLTGLVRESWTGYQVAWKMARGYSGSFGHKLNAPYVFLPLCAIFLLGLLDWRRPWRVANLDLLVLLGFGVSHFFFNRAEIGVSVPLVYPLLLYLFGRGLWIGLRGRGEGLRPVWPATWLLIAALFLVGFRVGLNVADSGVIDVGYASVVGADRIAHGEPLYGNFPEDVSQGDTYGPVNYYAYVPCEAVWPWSGTWDDLPAAHGAAVFFDLATFALLFLLGRRIRPGPAGRTLAATLAFGWAAYPYTAYVLESNSNDTLVALLLVATLLALARPVAAGSPRRPGDPDQVRPGPAGADAAHLPGDPPLPGRVRRRLPGDDGPGHVVAGARPGPAAPSTSARSPTRRTATPRSASGARSTAWSRCASRSSSASRALLAFAFWPRDKSLTQVAALGAALLIGVQLIAEHWFYLYIVWFYPLLLVAMATLEGRAGCPLDGRILRAVQLISWTASSARGCPALPSQGAPSLPVPNRWEPEPSPARSSPPAPRR